FARRHDARRLGERKLLGRDRDVRAPAGGNPGHLLLGEDLLWADAVGPDARRVDHVGRPDLEALAALGVRADDAGGPAAVRDQLDHLGAVHEHGAEARRLAQHGEHQADVVGLAVVEQIRLLGVPRCQRRDQLRRLVAWDRAVAVRRPVVTLGVLAGRPPPGGALAGLALAP